MDAVEKSSVDGAFATLVAPDGSRKPIGGGLGKVARDQVFDNVSTAAVRTNAVRVAPGLGLRDLRISVTTVLQDVITIDATAAASSIAELSTQLPLNRLLDGPPTRYEGVYLRLTRTGSPCIRQPQQR